MKRSRAIQHLVEIADEASDLLRFRATEIGCPLDELWVAGELLTDATTLDRGAVILVLDLPADELPWLAPHPTAEWIGDRLRLGKRPMRWCYRPAAWPVWTPDHRRAVRYWTAADGLDDGVIDALRERRLDRLPVVEPTRADLAAWLPDELAASRGHLRRTVDRYWDDDWRRDHKGFGVYPEDHLWRAACAVADIGDALDTL